MADILTPVQTPSSVSLDTIKLRLHRENIYQTRVPAYNLLRTKNGKALISPPIQIRQHNFQQFVEIYFNKNSNPDNQDLMSDNYGLPTAFTKESDGYKAFKRFADTDYGSYVIKEMLDNKEKYNGFDIMENASQGARGDWGD